MSTFDGNSSQPKTIAGRLQSFVDRIERLDAERRAIVDAIANALGFLRRITVEYVPVGAQ